MTTSTAHRRSSRSLVWLTAVLVGLVGLVAAPATALADKAEQARAHVAKATKAHKEGRYEQARVELEAAYALAPRPDLLYALGQVHAKLGNCREATAHFRRFLATQRDPQVAKVVDQAIAACTPAPVPVAASPAPAPARSAPAPAPEPAATADGAPAPSAAPAGPSAAPPSPGAPSAAPPAAPAPASEPPRSEPPPPPAPVARPAPARPPPFARARTAPTPVDPPRRSHWYEDKLGDGLLLGGVAATVIGLVEYRSALSDLDTAEDRRSTTTVAQYFDLTDRARGKRTAAIVLFGAGGALITGGVVRYVLHTGNTEAHGVGVAPAHGGGVVTYAGSF